MLELWQEARLWHLAKKTKTTALVVYRLEQLENKVDKHNSVVERTYKLEANFCLMDEKNQGCESQEPDLEDLGRGEK